MTKEQLDTVCEYKWRLEEELSKELDKGIEMCACDYHRHKMIASIIDTIKNIDDIMEAYDSDNGGMHELTPEMAEEWAMNMENADGTKGAHWTLDQTTAVANQNGIMFDHITPTDWMVALNMIYSDYGKALTDAGVTDIPTYVKMAKDFLFDKDAKPPKEKLYYYYKDVAKH